MHLYSELLTWNPRAKDIYSRHLYCKFPKELATFYVLPYKSK